MTSTETTEAIVAFLVRWLIHPKLSYANPERKAEILAEPSILVVNHTGHLDGPVVNTSFRDKRIHTLAAKDRFEQRVMGFMLRHTRCIPIDRNTPDLSWVHESLKVLNQDREHIAIYPEGRHGEHRKQLPFHPGVVMLAAIAQKPIVMIYVDGPARFFHSTGLIVSQPFRLGAPVKGLNSDYLNQQAVVLQDKMVELMNEYIRRNG